MAAEDSTAQQPAPGWDEAQCISALARLETLRQQLDELRFALPRVIEPLHQPQSPAMYKAFQSGIVNSQRGIRNFRSHWESEEVKGILEHCKESLDKDADLSKSVEVPMYGWIEKEKRGKNGRKKEEGKNDLDEGLGLNKEEVKRIVEDWKDRNAGLKVEAKEDMGEIIVQFVSASLKLRFRIIIERANGESQTLNAECQGTSEPFLAITRCISSRPQAKDLKYLLDMVAAYKTVKGTTCSKCKKMLDSAMLIPTARRSKQVNDGVNASSQTSWEALHESCLD